MTLVAIPAWNAQCLIPPINELNSSAAERSPYIVSLVDFVLRFGTSSARIEILDGLLHYRADMHDAGLTQGFQWLDGSFLEHVEVLESRAPNDIDVVTFYRLPDNKSQRDLLSQFPHLFDASAHQKIKNDYRVDSYLVHLGMTAERLIAQGNYWYSMWSHRRNQIWKGYVQIDLDHTEDADAKEALSNLLNQGIQP
jgi:hypothetical protein